MILVIWNLMIYPDDGSDGGDDTDSLDSGDGDSSDSTDRDTGNSSDPLQGLENEIYDDLTEEQKLSEIKN